MDDDADVRPLVDVRDDAADPHRVAARALVLRQRANRPDGGERWQIAEAALAALRCRQGRASGGHQREDTIEEEGPAAHGWGF